MLNRKITHTPFSRFIFACTLTLKRGFNEFLEVQLRSSKGVFIRISIEHYETEIVLNSNLIIPDFPHSIKIRLAPLNFFLLPPDFAKSGDNSQIIVGLALEIIMCISFVDILKETINQLILAKSINIFQLNFFFNTDQPFNSCLCISFCSSIKAFLVVILLRFLVFSFFTYTYRVLFFECS